MPTLPDGQSWRWLVVEFPVDDRPKLKHWLQFEDLAEMPGVIPVFRLPAGTRILEDANYREAVLRAIKRWSGGRPLASLELDYDCPTSRIGDYADWLKQVRQELGVKRLSVTCLASWIQAPNFKQLCDQVDELCPMFYDLERDDPQKVMQGEPLAFIDASTLKWIERWKRCSVPWLAGLPNFSRLSLFQANGKLSGHLRQWDDEALVRHPLLEHVKSEREGLMLFRATARTEFAGVGVPEGGLLVRRQPAEAGIMAAIREAKQAGASGVIWFAHPQSAPADAYSEAHLSSLLMGRQPKPALRQRVDPGGSIVLTNEGTGDVLLLPGAQLHAWRVEANASMKFADPAPGEFVEMQPAGVLVEPEALSHIELYYSKLPAGGSIRSAAGTIGNSPKK